MLLVDLHRSRLAWIGFSLLGRLFLHRSFALEDGRLSICKSFSLRELEDYRRGLAAPARARVLRLAPYHLALSGSYELSRQAHEPPGSPARRRFTIR